MDSKDFEDIYYRCQNNPNLPDVKLGKFSAKNYRSLGVSTTAHSVKSDNPDLLKKRIAINKIADHIINQNVLTPKDTIIPAPQHTGRAEYTLEIAKIISEKTGCKIADILGCVPRDTLYNLKKRNGSNSITDSGIYLLNNKFPKYNVWFLDNVAATGTTFNDARKLIPHIKPLIYSISPRLKVKMKNRKPYFIRESENKKIKNLISKIIRYRDICNDTWSPFAWKILYEEIPEGLKITIDTDQYFDKKHPLGHFINCILDICDHDYSEDESVYELTGINPYRDIEFVRGEPNDYATYIVHSESRSMNESKLKEGPSPKWKQKILDDINDIFDIVYSVVNDENGEWKEPEKYLSFSVNKFIELIKTLVDTEKYSENLLKYVAIDLWIELHCDDSVGDFNDGPEPKLKFAKYLNLRKELWSPLCDEYQAKYGRKKKPQPYIKDPTDASEIFDKFHQLRYENRSLKMDFKRIYESSKESVNLYIWETKHRITPTDLETLANKIDSYRENEWDGYYPMPRIFLDFVNDYSLSRDLFFGICDCDANIDLNNFEAPPNDYPIEVELFYDDREVSFSELKNILKSIKEKEERGTGYDEFYLDLEKVEGNKLFFSEGYDEKD